jgi:hypothetical protein
MILRHEVTTMNHIIDEQRHRCRNLWPVFANQLLILWVLMMLSVGLLCEAYGECDAPTNEMPSVEEVENDESPQGAPAATARPLASFALAHHAGL